MIRGEIVVLRTIQEKDLDGLFELLSDVKNRGAFVPWDLPTQVGHRKQFQENSFWGEELGPQLICVSDQTVGTIAFAKADYLDTLEIGYAIFYESHKNKGYATEALSLFSPYLFSTKKINRLQVSINPGNTPSRRVAEKCGYTFEGILREALFNHGEDQDVALYSLLRREVSGLLR